MRLKVETAQKLGISLKRFQGWEPQTLTRYEYDDQGRIRHTVSTTETEWDDTQQAWMIAYHLYEADRCSGCGGRWSETTDRKNEEAYVTEAIRCHSCTARAIAHEAAQNVHQPSAVYRIVRRADGKADH